MRCTRDANHLIQVLVFGMAGCDEVGAVSGCCGAASEADDVVVVVVVAVEMK